MCAESSSAVSGAAKFAHYTLLRFPRLFAALLLAVIWEGLFGRMDPLDFDGLIAAHLEMVLHRLGMNL